MEIVNYSCQYRRKNKKYLLSLTLIAYNENLSIRNIFLTYLLLTWFDIILKIILTIYLNC